MRDYVVAVVGRPNVGKSTLFNALAGDRISIVDDKPGVTRDRIYAKITWLNNTYTLIDTGGIEPTSNDMMLTYMREQAQIAIDTADVIVFVVDVRTGLTDSDSDVAEILRRSGKPIVLCVNKVDNFQRFENDIYEFYNLGMGDPIGVSAASKLGFGDLLDAVSENCANLAGDAFEEEEDTTPKIAIVGKPNVGKSSIINKLCGENRVIVSNIAGTTRDAIDTRVKHHGKEYIFIDTAGLRRKSKIKEDIERYSIIRTVAAVERCDVCVLVIDGKEGISEQDAKIAGIAHDSGKGIIIAVNKWDIVEDKDAYTINRVKDEVRDILSFIPYAEIMFISAQTGQRLIKLYDEVDDVLAASSLRIQTGMLNTVLNDAMVKQQPPTDKGKRLKIYYMTQVSIKPPTFVIFVNDKQLMHFSYTRYIENQLRETFGFKGTALHFIIRERSDKENPFSK